jgi:hypothetical protein
VVAVPLGVKYWLLAKVTPHSLCTERHSQREREREREREHLWVRVRGRVPVLAEGRVARAVAAT